MVGIVGYALFIHVSLEQIALLVLTAMLSAVPVALSATFTLAAALGAKTLALRGVLLTRLSSLHEAATIDVLCCDKTGTLTLNELTVGTIRPIDRAMAKPTFSAMRRSPVPPTASTRSMPPFAKCSAKAATPDGRRASPRISRRSIPATKMAEAVALDQDRDIRVVKGAPAVVARRCADRRRGRDRTRRAHPRRLSHARRRGRSRAALWNLIGFIAFADPPRPDSAELLNELRTLGVRPVMVTGDAAATAAAVAHAIGLEGPVCPPGDIPDSVGPDDFAVYAGVLPEQKFRLVKAFQHQGHAVGMCGDGANDAPALRQAQMGIAVSTATDVAKSAAGVVLTEPGLGGIVACIKEGRSAFQRVLTYTLMILVNKCVTLIVLGVGLVITGHAVLTPLLQALSMLTNDFVTMSRAADRAPPSAYPNAWRVAQSHARRTAARRLPAALSGDDPRPVLARHGSEPGPDADADLRHAGLRRTRQYLRVARTRPAVAFASRDHHGAGIGLRRRHGRLSGGDRRADGCVAACGHRHARGCDACSSPWRWIR